MKYFYLQKTNYNQKPNYILQISVRFQEEKNFIHLKLNIKL